MHLGSVFTALASYLDARANGGRWLLRIDDLDTARNRPDSVSAILKCLEAYGLFWDDAIYFQSQHLEDYRDCLAMLDNRGLTYRCECSRKSLANLSAGMAQADYHEIYPRICANKHIDDATPHAIRLRTGGVPISIRDGLQGTVERCLESQEGDFILMRKDGIVAYTLAVVVDDYLQNVTHVVRGYDLLLETPKQVYLQSLLHFPSPEYKHVPVVVDHQGFKLSKQTLATAVDCHQPARFLVDLLTLMNQEPPVHLGEGSVTDVLEWAVTHWQIERLANRKDVAMV